MQVIKVKIKPKEERLDQFVASQVRKLTRSQAKKLIKEGNILVSGRAVDPSYRVQKDDKISIEIPPPKEVSLKAESIPLKIIFEDQDILVIDKQAGLVVHPTLDHPSGTVVNALLHHLKNFNQQGDLRPGVVHRLDKDTSGILLIAKNQKSLENLKQQFKNHLVKKEYLALVSGVVEKEKGSINKPIARHPKFRSKFTIAPEGREALTEYQVEERLGSFTLLFLKPRTGRTHQLRVHLSAMGHPIVGDKLYGGKMLLSRQFLHAAGITFKHPTSAKLISFSAPLPSDLEKVLTRLRGK